MRYHFEVADDGLVDVVLDGALPLLGEALRDSLGTRPPRGASQGGPSTYWIDHAIQRIHSVSGEPFASGNITFLEVRGGTVVAGYDFDPEGEADAVPIDSFVALLHAWRERVIAESPMAATRVPPPANSISLD